MPEKCSSKWEVDMNLQVLSKNDTPIPPAIEDYAIKRVSKMDRFLPSIDSGKIEISEEGIRRPDQRYSVQVTLESGGVIIRAHEHADDMRSAIDRVSDALTNRINRYKGKRFEHSKDSLRKMEPAIVGADVPEEEERRLVKTKSITVKPMPIDEAAEQMELLGHDFFLFINSETGNTNLVYKRKDGHYGLIESSV